MSLYDNGSNNMVMPVSPMGGGYGGTNGFGWGDVLSGSLFCSCSRLWEVIGVTVLEAV